MTVTALVLGFIILAMVGFLSAITQFKSITGVACCGMMGLGGWYIAAVATPPTEFEPVNVQIVHMPMTGESELVGVARHPVTGKNVIWKHEGKQEDKYRAYFANPNAPRLYMNGINVSEQPRLVRQ